MSRRARAVPRYHKTHRSRCSGRSGNNCTGRGGKRAALLDHLEQAGDFVFQVFAVYDKVEEAVF